jgi:hypothetical protein
VPRSVFAVMSVKSTVFVGGCQSETAHARREIVIIRILSIRFRGKHGGAGCLSGYLQRYGFGAHHFGETAVPP